MRFYLIFSVLIPVLFSIMLISSAYAYNNQSNGIYFHEEKCSNNSCIIINCVNNQPCNNSTLYNNKTSANNLLPSDIL